MVALPRIIGKKVFRYPTLDSTNDEARRLIAKGEGEGVVVAAEEQTKGKGKPGRSWYSPAGLGIYLSVIVKPYKNPSALAPITLAAAEAVVKTIKKTAGLSAEIKMPNDVMLAGKKLCGILVERLKSGYVIIGIGINVNNLSGSFPAEIAETATSLKIAADKQFDLASIRCVLLSELDNAYLAYLEKI